MVLHKPSSKNRRRTWQRLPALVGGALGLSLAAWADTPQRCDTAAARLESLEGRVEWQAAGDTQWHNAQLYQTFCYGDRLIVREERAALRLSNQTLVRLNQHASLKLVPPDTSFWVELLDGAAHFLSRTPKAFGVKAPYLNAAVEGTEFLVSAQSAQNSVGVLEGKVRAQNPRGELLLASGQEARTPSSQTAPASLAPAGLKQMVSWALYFPPLPAPAQLDPAIAQALAQRQHGPVLERIEQSDADAQTLAFGAALALDKGDTERAQRLVARALAADPQEPDAMAIKTLVDFSLGDLDKSRRQAALNVLSNPFNASGLMVYSYSLQSQGLLPQALGAAERAQELSPQDVQVLARVAELHLALGQRDQANNLLDQALKSAPEHSRLLTFKGFSLLAQRQASRALDYFSRAAAQDSADPYSQLGWGLALIQQGDLAQGREHLELAVLLDPVNSLLRSYLGKAYFEEQRPALAQDQYSLAKHFDPMDPTPWYYQSQVLYSQRQLPEALQALDVAIDKNDNRQVYRGNRQLDADQAARLADKAQIYTAMGADLAARRAARQAYEASPPDASGHRALALALQRNPQAQAARASETQLANLLAPIGMQAFSPAFSDNSLQVLPGAGPQEMGINEFNAAFLKQGVNGFASLLAAGNNTRAAQGQLNALGENTTLSIGQYRYDSDGYTTNNDREYLINEGLLRHALFDNLLIQLDGSYRDERSGDLSDKFVGSTNSAVLRRDANRDALGFSFAYQATDQLRVLGRLSNKWVDSKSVVTETILPIRSIVQATRDRDGKAEIREIKWSYALWDGELDGGLLDYSGDYSLLTQLKATSSRNVVLRNSLVNALNSESYRSIYLDYFSGTINDLFSVYLNYEELHFEHDTERDGKESLYDGALSLKCPYQLVCRIGRGSSMAPPTIARDSIKSNAVGRWNIPQNDNDFSISDYEFLSIDGAGRGISYFVGFEQRTVLQRPQNVVGSPLGLLRPKFDEKNLDVELSYQHLLIGEFVLEYENRNGRQAAAEVGVSFRSVPVTFSGNTLGLTYSKKLYNKYRLEFVLEDVVQEYTLETGENDKFVSSENDFYNVDLKFFYDLSAGVSWGFGVLNALGNEDGYFEEPLSNSFGAGDNGFEKYVPERVYFSRLVMNF
jgi:ferric-dicitrate binding protein FerR (iron transport regulator)